MDEEYKENENSDQSERKSISKAVDNDQCEINEYNKDEFNIAKLLEVVESFHNFLEEAEPDASVECFGYIVTYMREIPMNESLFERLLHTDIIIDLVDYTDMFDDNFAIVLDAMHCLHTLIMNNVGFRLQFIENSCIIRIIQILDSMKYPEEINVIILQMISCLYAEPLSFDVFDTKEFFRLIEKLSKSSNNPEILLYLSSIVDLSLHYLENEKKDFFELAMFFFERLKEMPDDFPCDEIMERVTGGFANFTSSTNDDIIWLIDNNIVSFCLNDGDGFPSTVQIKLVDFLSMVFNHLPKVIVSKVLPEQAEMEVHLKRAAEQVQIDKIESILGSAIEADDHVLIISVVRLLEAIVQHSEDFFVGVYQSSCFSTILSLLIESDYKIKSAVIDFLYESSEYFTATVINSFVDSDLVDVFESFLSSKFETSEKVYQLCLRFYATTEEGSDVSERLHELINDYDPKEDN